MKKMMTLFVSALIAASFATVALAEDHVKKNDEKSAAEKSEGKDTADKKGVKKDTKKDKSAKKKDEKPAKKGATEVSGC